MATAADIIGPALERIKVKDPSQELSSEDATTGIRYLNDMMLALADHDGVSLGYTIVSASTDEVTTPDWTHGMMRANLAVQMADEFGKTITAGLAALADLYLKGVKGRMMVFDRPHLPDGLPTGQGNSAYGYNYGVNNNFFYDEGKDALRDDLGAPMADEDGNALWDENVL